MNQNIQNLFLREVLAKYKIHPPIFGGGGSSVEDAIIIDLENNEEAVRLEYTIVNVFCAVLDKTPKPERQEHLSRELKHYDKLTFSFEGDSKTYEIYFDITKSFSKFAAKF